MQTSYTGAVESTYTSLPFGDGYSASGGDIDAYHFAGQDQDSSASDHAWFRQYSNMTGRWFSPDPYSGSYDPLNPQSMNRYAYVLGNPLTFTDALGLYLVCYETPDTGWDGGDNTVGVTAGSSVCDSVGYGPVGGGYGPNYGQIGGGGGGAGAGTSSAPSVGVKNCGSQAAWSFALHGGIDALAAIPGLGTGVAATQIAIGVVNTDWSTSGKVAQLGQGLSVFGSANGFVGAIPYIAESGSKFAEAIPGVGIFVGFASVSIDAYNAVKQYQSCTAGH
uniref:RHS repeat-associated core domain-containing protein n=1 Tax=mine drainage metagenome TaxID=410659 RepID=E6QP30_9ZZZZ